MAATSNGSEVFSKRGEYELAIFYEDTDLSGFVYHANYLKYFERAREELVSIKFLRDCMDMGIHFVVASCDVKFKRPARHGDIVKVVSHLEFSKSPVSSYLQEAFCEGELLVSANIRIAALGHNNRPTRLPSVVFEALKAI